MRDVDALRGHWDKVWVFLAVLRNGSVAQAARVLLMQESTVKRHIADLERSLGATLFHRSSTGTQPTEAAERLKEPALAMERAAADMARMLAGMDGAPEGNVRIACTDGLAAFWVAPRLGPLYDRFPGISVKLLNRTDIPDLSAGEADVWIGYEPPVSQQAVKRTQLGTMHFVLVASEAYLAARGIPRSWPDLESHSLLTHTYYAGHHGDDSDWSRWNALVEANVRVRVETDLSMALLNAVLGGYGIALQPSGVLDVYPQLRPIPIDIEANATFWLAYHERMGDIARFRVVIDALKMIMIDAGLRGPTSPRLLNHRTGEAVGS
jgi:DNA-binding transcriptional LysR family regulator